MVVSFTAVFRDDAQRLRNVRVVWEFEDTRRVYSALSSPAEIIPPQSVIIDEANIRKKGWKADFSSVRPLVEPIRSFAF